MLIRNYIGCAEKSEIETIAPIQPNFKLFIESRHIDGVRLSMFESNKDMKLTVEQERTIKLVRELRELTGAGMMDCKKALFACDLDIERAIEYIRNNNIVRSI